MHVAVAHDSGRVVIETWRRSGIGICEQGPVTATDTDVPVPEVPARHVPRWRRITAAVLVVVSCVLAPLSIVAIWVRDQVLDTDRYVENVAPLATNPEIIDTIARNATNRLFEAVDVEAVAEESLPRAARFLAGPLEETLRQFTYETATKVLSSEQFADLWESANRRAHAQVQNVLTGGGETVQTEDGRVVVDLTNLLEQVRTELSDRGIGIFDRIPIEQLALEYELMDATQLEKAQRGVELLDSLSWLLPLTVFVLLGIAVWLSPNRRRTLLRWGIGVALAVAVLGAAVAVARAVYLDEVTGPRLPEATAAAVFDTLLRFLRQSVRVVFVFALVVAAGAWLAGPSSAARRVRATFRGTTGALGERAGARGLDFGAFGLFVRAHLAAARIAGVLLGLVVLMLWDHPRATTLLWITLVVLVYLALVELVARAAATGAGPTPAPEPRSGDA
jgi:hypothetical protein